MRVSRYTWTPDGGWLPELPASDLPTPAEPVREGSTLVLAFCDPALAGHPDPLAQLCAAFPSGVVVGCSTAGQISDDVISDGGLVATVAEFESSRVVSAIATDLETDRSRKAGRDAASSLARDGCRELKAVFVLSDGLRVNGSQLVAGLREGLPGDIPISGGLAGDGPRFERTWVSLGARPMVGAVVAVGLCGENLVLGHGSQAGWVEFGPERKITSADGPTLYELDFQPALDLYRAYLGDKASELPGSALLFPLQIRSPDGRISLIRTVLAIDSEEKSMRFAGDMPEGWMAQLMRTTVDRLVDGAVAAAAECLLDSELRDSGTLVLAVSCVGRRLVMGVRADEEADACLAHLAEGSMLSGFYSYGEIAPVNGFSSLHNQTMTLTSIGERSR